jgi:hypothetical protein
MISRRELLSAVVGSLLLWRADSTQSEKYHTTMYAVVCSSDQYGGWVRGVEKANCMNDFLTERLKLFPKHDLVSVYHGKNEGECIRAMVDSKNLPLCKIPFFQKVPDIKWKKPKCRMA